MRKNSKNSLSVIVPIFNVDKYLEVCLDSLCKAILDIKNKEVICVNDGSTDNSLAIIKQFQQDYDFVKLIDKPNAGYGAAINSGLDACKGEYVTIVESDDCIIPNIHSKLIKKLNENPDADFIKTPFHIWQNGRVMRTARIQNAPEDPFTVYDFSPVIMFAASIWSAVYRRDFLIKNNINVIETPGASYQDTYFSTLLYLLGGKMLYHDEAYYLYRTDRENASTYSKTKTNEMIVIQNAIKAFLEKRNLFHGRTKQLYYASSFPKSVWFFSTVAPNFHNEIFKLTYAHFKPVFLDPVLYACVELELTDQEKDLLAELKKGQSASFQSSFNKNNFPEENRLVDFMFYRELDRYISNTWLVRTFKRTMIYQFVKSLFDEVGKVLTLFIYPLSLVYKKIIKKLFLIFQGTKK